MAFKKNDETNQKLANGGLANKNPEPPAKPQFVTISIPLVFKKTKQDDEIIYTGFVPGIIMRDVICNNLDECKQKLLPIIEDKLKTKVQLQSQMPFFPTNEEILQDFQNVCMIKRIKFTYKSYQTL